MLSERRNVTSAIEVSDGGNPRLKWFCIEAFILSSVRKIFSKVGCWEALLGIDWFWFSRLGAFHLSSFIK